MEQRLLAVAVGSLCLIESNENANCKGLFRLI